MSGIAKVLWASIFWQWCPFFINTTISWIPLRILKICGCLHHQGHFIYFFSNRALESFLFQVLNHIHETIWRALVPSREVLCVLPGLCKSMEGGTFCTHKHANKLNWQHCRGFVLILSSTSSYSRTRKRCSSVYLLIVTHTHTHTPTVLGFKFAWLHHGFLHSYGKWTAVDTACCDAARSGVWQFVRRVPLICKRTIVRRLSYTVMLSRRSLNVPLCSSTLLR